MNASKIKITYLGLYSVVRYVHIICGYFICFNLIFINYFKLGLCDTPYTPYTKLQVQPNSTSKDVSHYPTSTMSLSEIMAFKKKLSSLSNT